MLPLQPRATEAPAPTPTRDFSALLPLSAALPLSPGTLGADLVRAVLAPIQQLRPPDPAEAAFEWLQATFQELGAQEDAMNAQIERAL